MAASHAASDIPVAELRDVMISEFTFGHRLVKHVIHVLRFTVGDLAAL
jgi:hypothetical protein